MWWLCLILAQQGGPPIEEGIRVEYVTLDVLAIDAKGRPVTDLTEKDFEIRENRKKIDFDGFRRFDLRAGRIGAEALETIDPAGGEEVEKTLADQKILLVLDLEEAYGTNAKRTLDQLDDFVGELPGHLPYVFRVFSLEYGEETDGWVDSRVVVREALTRIRERWISDHVTAGMKSNDETLLGNLEQEPLKAREGYDYRRLGGDFTLLEKAIRDCIYSYNLPSEVPNRILCIEEVLTEFKAYHQERSERVIGEIYGILAKLGDDPDIKSMLLVSPGFSLTAFESVLRLRDEILRQEGSGSLIGDFMNMTDYFQSKKVIEQEYRKLLHYCLARRVVINVFDIYNRREALSIGDARRKVSPALRSAYTGYWQELNSGSLEIASDTGGELFETARLEGGMGKVLERGSFYYQLGYTSPPGKPGKWRKIQVKCKRKGVRLIYRSGYYGG